MKAIQIVDQKLSWADTEAPKPGLGEVAIRVRATAINRADLAQRAGVYPPPPGASEILGLKRSTLRAKMTKLNISKP